MILLSASAPLHVTLDPATLTAPDSMSTVVKLMLILTVLSVLPSILIMFTSFVRLIVVFHFVRQAMGAQGMPPNQVLVGLALILTFFVMAPVGERIYETAIQPYQEGKLTGKEALDLGVSQSKEWMLRNTREADLLLFAKLADVPRPATRSEVPLQVVVPAFLISELKSGFQIGFMLFIPFLVIDLVVASVLLSMGMMMLPPVIVSLPFKVLLFVLADGWHLLVEFSRRLFQLTPMNETVVLEIGRSGIQVALVLAAPLLFASLTVGILVSLIQVATSLQDATMTFVPKIVGVGLLLLIVSGWMIRTLVNFTRTLIESIPGAVG